MNRNIYSYHDASGEVVHGDPGRILRIITAHCGGDVSNVIAKSRVFKRLEDGTIQVLNAPEDAERHMQQLLDGVSAAFKLPRWDEKAAQGVQDDVLLDLLNDFYDWTEKKNPSGGSAPTSPQSTDFPSSPPSSPPRGAPSTTTAPSGSG